MAACVRIRCVEKLRTCLRCNTTFFSLSSANRICPRCKKQPFGPIADPVRLCPEESDELTVDINDLLNRQSKADRGYDDDDLDFLMEPYEPDF
ncbi:MAG TPA: hypothetical protein VM223_19970 [Planctomycetota bacterium]|nr:hypothetical protein [Planctomycetota bacterium]